MTRDQFIFKKDNEERMLSILKRAVKMINKARATALKVYEAKFGLGIDDNHPNDRGTLDTCVTVTIQNTRNKKTIKLHYYESKFDVNIPDRDDIKAGVNKVTKDENKILLRLAYSIWFYSRRIADHN